MSQDQIQTVTSKEANATDQSYTPVTGTDVGTKRALDLNIAGSGGLSVNTAIRIDDTTTAGTTYYGFAAIGTLDSAASWQIFKGTLSSGVTSYTWADSDDSPDNVWDNRASLSYG